MFDSYCIPMNPLNPEIKQWPVSSHQISDYVERVEDMFNLPPKILIQKRGGRAMKRYKDVSLSEVRKAAVYNLLTLRKIPYPEVGHFFGVDRTGIFYILKRAKKHLEAGDEKFNHYYSMVSTIAI